MDAKEYIQGQIAAMRRLSDAVLQETTDEQLNWTPPGTANPIKASLVHLFIAEDRFIQTVLAGGRTVWETGDWGEKIGLPIPPGRGRGWDEVKAATLTLAPVLDYGRAVCAATDAYVAVLAPEELERRVDFFGGERPVADVLATLVVHTMGHIGEIAALKGAQGARGIPF